MTFHDPRDVSLSAVLTATSEITRPRTASRPPVFLHCGWRTRGTWIWNRFRDCPGVTAYYEPLSQVLARLTPEAIASHTADAWPSGHVGITRPYFVEFLPLLYPGQSGVPDYRADFAREAFFASADANLPDLYRYVSRLLTAARRSGRQPVLKFCGSIGRVGWMHRNFPDAVHIVVMRDPFTQFASAQRLLVHHGNGYYLGMPLHLLALNTHLAPIARCAAHLDFDPPRVSASRGSWEESEQRLRETDPAAWYRAFLAFWVVTAASIPDCVELVIDSDALARPGPRRRHYERALAGLTGQFVEFNDAVATGETAPAAAMGLRRSDIVRAHSGAEAFLAEQRGPYWADVPALVQVGTLLARARALAMADELSGEADADERVGNPGPPDLVAEMMAATVRARIAERELDALRRSRSWKLTAPFRRMVGAFGKLA
jgi:hypothetical protein